MSPTYSNTAIAFESLRDSLLYFDYVIPVNLAVDFIGPYSQEPVGPLPPLDYSMMPPQFRGNEEYSADLRDLNLAMADLVLHELAEELDHRFGGTRKWPLTTTQKESLESATKHFYQFVDRYDLRTYPLDCGANLFEDEPNSIRDCNVVSLPSLRLVDVSKCSWEQLLEFRKDREAVSRLRRLRLFAFDNYLGKSREYVGDHILSKVEEYDDAVKTWGFETTEGVIRALLGSKALGGAASGTLASVLLGSPAATTVGAISVGVVTLGQAVCEISRKKFALDTLRRDHPVSFISYARDQLQGDG